MSLLILYIICGLLWNGSRFMYNSLYAVATFLPCYMHHILVVARDLHCDGIMGIPLPSLQPTGMEASVAGLLQCLVVPIFWGFRSILPLIEVAHCHNFQKHYCCAETSKIIQIKPPLQVIMLYAPTP